MYALKFLVLLACCALSGFGVLLMFLGGVFSFNAGWWQVLLLLWPAAVIAFVLLSLAWLEGRPLGGRAAFVATALGVSGLFAFPLLLHLSARESLSPLRLVRVTSLESLFILPALLLAIYLVWYHARPVPAGRHGA
jgi:hypothetical protein